MTAMTDKTSTPETAPPAGTQPGPLPDPRPDLQAGPQADPASAAKDAAEAVPAGTLTGPEQKPGEIGGPKGPEPTRYGDWEFKGRCSDF